MDRIIHGDSIEELKVLPDNSVDLVCTDPPYGIGFMGKAWDTFSPAYQQQAREREAKRAPRTDGRRATGFQDAAYAGSYDNSLKGRQGFQKFMYDICEQCLRVLKPGAFMFVTMTPRQDCLSRVMIAMEDAGFNTGFTSMYWTYASGFPKAANIGKLADKRQGTTRQIIGPDNRHNSQAFGKDIFGNVIPQETRGNSPLEGSYGGFQPKPAVEVIIVAMKPLSEQTFVGQALANGKGITWLDDCRVPIADDTGVWGTSNATTTPTFNASPTRHAYRSRRHDGGRFPANLLVSDNTLQTHSRFFSLDSWADTLPFLIVRKASKAEKHAGLDHLESNVLARSGGAQHAVKRGRDAYLKQHIGLNRAMHVKNNHPTVKPLKLMSYLITLGSRAGDVVLDPFVGSGTTALAANMLGRRFIGIEREAEYVDIARARLKAVPPMQPTTVAAE